MSAEKIAIINEHLGKAVEAADLVLMDLRQANLHASPLLHIVLLQEIEVAAQSVARLQNLRNAHKQATEE